MSRNVSFWVTEYIKLLLLPITLSTSIWTTEKRLNDSPWCGQQRTPRRNSDQDPNYLRRG